LIDLTFLIIKRFGRGCKPRPAAERLPTTPKRKYMMTSVEAVFEQGVFRPLTPIPFLIPEGQPLKINIETKSDCNDALKLATNVYNGLSKSEINEIEQIALDRTHFLNEGKRSE